MTEPTIAPVVSRRRTLIVTAFLAGAITLIAEATFEYMLVPIQVELSISVDETNILALVPDMAGLLAVFAAGALAVRFGRRLILAIGAVSVCLGSILVGLAPSVPVLLVGRMFGGIGSVTLTVLGLSLINISFTEPAHRARAFGVLGAVTPTVFIIAPLLGAFVTEHVGWRFVPVLWFIGAFTVLVLALFSVPRATRNPHHMEFATPILGGLALSSICVVATTMLEPNVLTAVALATLATVVVVLTITMRRLPHPTLDLRVLRAPGGLLAATAIFVVMLVNMSFYVNLLVQYRYQLSLTTTAFLLALPEVAGIAGSLFFGAVAGRVGARTAATFALLTASVVPLLFFSVTSTSPVAHLVIVAILTNIPVAGAMGPLAETLLNLAPSDGSDAAASVHDAITNVAFVVGGLIVGVIAFGGFQRSLTDQLMDRGVPEQQAVVVAEDVRNGAVISEMLDRANGTDTALHDVLGVEGAGLNQAQIDALRLTTLALVGTNALGAGLLVVSARRRRELGAAPLASVAPSEPA